MSQKEDVYIEMCEKPYHTISDKGNEMGVSSRMSREDITFVRQAFIAFEEAQFMLQEHVKMERIMKFKVKQLELIKSREEEVT